jgi:hypothetical protein
LKSRAYRAASGVDRALDGHRGSPFDCRCPHRPFSARAIAGARTLLDRRTFLAGIAAAAGASFPRLLRAAEPARTNVTLLRAARLFDGTALREPGVLVVRGDRIVSLNAGDAGAEARTIDLGDATLMPGLIDAHTHVAANVVESRYLEALARPDSVADSIAEATLFSIKLRWPKSRSRVPCLPRSSTGYLPCVHHR